MKRLFLLSITLFLGARLLTGCGEEVRPGASEVARREITGLKVSEARLAEADDTFEEAGSIKAKTVSRIGAKVMGAVTSIRVTEGDRVKKGQVLLTIDDSDMAQRLRASEAGYREAGKGLEAAGQNKALSEITYLRYLKLKEGKAVSEQEFNQIETQRSMAELEYERMQEALQRAQAGVNEARAFLGYSTITSPVSGVVTEKKTDVGSMATPGTALLTIEDTSSYLLEADIDEGLSGRLRPGMPVHITVDALGKDFKGAITEVVPSVNPASRTSLLKASIKGAGLKSGLYAKVKIPVGKKTVLAVPGSAVVRRGGLTGVYSVDDKGIISYRLIRAGAVYGRDVEVLSGISPGEKVVAEGVEKAADGAILK